MRPQSYLVLVALVTALAGESSFAQCPVQRWRDPRGTELEFFGGALAASGDVCLAAAQDLAGDVGSVQVFERVGGTWLLADRLQPSDGPSGRSFGRDVAVDGDVAIVGAFLADGAAPESGAAYVFRSSGGAWFEEAKLHAAGGLMYSEYGVSVATSGGTVVVGAPGELTSGGGFVYVYEHGLGGWVLDQRLEPLPTTSHDSAFGMCVDIDGGRIVVSEPFSEQPPGLLHVFERGPGGWARVALLRPGGLGPEAQLGRSLDLEDERLAVGCPGDDGLAPGGGTVLVFERGPAGWSRTARLFPSEGTSDQDVGWSVTLEGERLAFGRPGDDDLGPSTGAAYLFIQVAGEWQPASKWYAGSPWSQSFGHALQLHGMDVFVGAPLSLVPSGLRVGSLHRFSLAGGWSHGYCAASPNSTGAVAGLALESEACLGGGPLVFSLTNLPPFALGFLVHGRDPAQLPFGDGLLCIAPYAPGLSRVLPPVAADAEGRAEVTLEPSAQPPAATLVAGVPWHFQHVYRDPGSGSGFNLSAALRTALCR